MSSQLDIDLLLPSVANEDRTSIDTKLVEDEYDLCALESSSKTARAPLHNLSTEECESTLLPIEYLGVFSTLGIDFEAFGYYYIGIAFPNSKFPSHISCHYVKHLMTDQVYIAKILDLYGQSNQYKSRIYKHVQLSQSLSLNYSADQGNPFLEKPNVVFQLEWFNCFNNLIMIHDYCNGGDLFTLILNSRTNGRRYLKEEQVSNIFREICLGIAYLHNRDIVHGDIKSSNIFFKENTPVIGDLETAHYINEGSGNNQAGTIMYMAPELILDVRCTTNFKTDIWALGCLLFELLTLSHPFSGPCNLEEMMLHFSSFDSYLKGLLAAVPCFYRQKWTKLLKKLLNFNPNLRPNIKQILELI